MAQELWSKASSPSGTNITSFTSGTRSAMGVLRSFTHIWSLHLKDLRTSTGKSFPLRSSEFTRVGCAIMPKKHSGADRMVFCNPQWFNFVNSAMQTHSDLNMSMCIRPSLNHMAKAVVETSVTPQPWCVHLRAPTRRSLRSRRSPAKKTCQTCKQTRSIYVISKSGSLAFIIDHPWKMSE